jgi:hypothetical protein
MGSAIVVADTSVLINFLRIDRMDLIGRHPQRFLATDHVDAEITNDYAEQRTRYQNAVASGLLDTCTVVHPEEVELFLRLGPGERLGAAVRGQALCARFSYHASGVCFSHSHTRVDLSHVVREHRYTIRHAKG